MRKIKFFILTYLFSLSLTPAYGQTDNKELDNFYNSLYSILRETDKNITEFTIFKNDKTCAIYRRLYVLFDKLIWNE